mgnify:CR=1 FL=1
MTAAVTREHPPAALMRVVNPVVRAVLRSPLHRAADGAVLVLHLTGRRTGRRYDIPLGFWRIEGRLTIFTNSRWRANLRPAGEVEVTWRGRRQPMQAQLEEDPATVATAYQRVIEELGWQRAQRRLGLRIHVRRAPTLAELEEVVRTSGLSIVTLTPR